MSRDIALGGGAIGSLLIRDVCIDGVAGQELAVRDGYVREIGEQVGRSGLENVVDAGGGCVLPGLHDHHLHLLGIAGRQGAVDCGTPEIADAEDLRGVLERARSEAGPSGGVRGVNLRRPLTSLVSRAWLDEIMPDLPVRIDDDTGHALVLNTPAFGEVRRLNKDSASALAWLRSAYESGWLLNGRRRLRMPAFAGTAPDLAGLSRELSRLGITGVTDATVQISDSAIRRVESAVRDGAFRPRVLLLSGPAPLEFVTAGPKKLVLAEYDLPSLPELIDALTESRLAGQPVAVHVMSAAPLYMLLTALEHVGSVPGDRIEHASITPGDALGRIRRLGLTVVTQPNFVAERGSRYLEEVEPGDLDSLYRLRSFLEQGVPLAGGSDAPVGSHDPWQAMQAAVRRETRDGRSLGPNERISPAQALDLYLGSLDSPGKPRRVVPGMEADLCVLTAPLDDVYRQLNCSLVAATIRRGVVVYSA